MELYKNIFYCSSLFLIYLYIFICSDIASPVCFPEKQEREVDIYANLSDEKAFVFSVALAEINRKILGQRLIL